MNTDTQKKFVDLRAALNNRHMERFEEIDIVLTALVAKQHVAFIGAPGSAKSMLAEDIVDALYGAEIFKTQINQFSTPEEIFGPLNVEGLKMGVYERVIDNMLPVAEVAYIDEFFNANSSLQNNFLLAMNERLFKQGSKRVQIPLISLIASSNHFPQGEDLWALWDRFHFRKKVDYIHEPGNFVKVLRGVEHLPLPSLTMDDLSQAWHEAAEIEIPEDVYERVLGIRGDLSLEGIIVSDRRFRQSMFSLQAYAWLNGDEQVDDAHFTILQHMLWSEEAQYKPVVKIVLKHTNPLELAAEEIIDQVDEIASQLAAALTEMRNTNAEPSEALSRQGVEWFHKCKMLGKDLKKLRVKAEENNRRVQKVDQAKERLVRTSREIGRLLKIEDDD